LFDSKLEGIQLKLCNYGIQNSSSAENTLI